ncbi:Inositol-pentakisphosphate 2-kinase [Sporothrix epigloea]|uniref:Inositol-pentakisphosphate 2-kinase n=1 Tax=Sporothrix epigloea TaxID=1892477 RepID=A0ABP0D9F1_9PEZI
MAARAVGAADDVHDGRRYATALANDVANPLLHPQSPEHQQLLQPQPQPSSSQIVSMPSAVRCSFIGEGSANAVFCVTPICDMAGEKSKSSSGRGGAATRGTGSSADAGPLSTHLLRIPKAGPGVGPDTCLEHHAYYSNILRPLFGAEWLVGQQLIQGVNSSGVHAMLNDMLADMDRGHRGRPDWVGTRVAENIDVALLVEDMTAACKEPSYPSSTVIIQCKPKWLVQSPSAPVGARRCRTCALAAASATSPATDGAELKTGHTKNSMSYKTKPCPLVLVAEPPSTSQEEVVLESALWDYVCEHLGSAVAFTSSSPGSPSIKLSSGPALSLALKRARPAITRWLRTTDFFRRLAAIQADFDPCGALSVDSSAAGASALQLERLQTAMTLRDCTCFLRIKTSDDPTTSEPVVISAKLGDLDRKDGRRKLARWQMQERTLLSGRFYLGTEKPRQSTQCWLERQRP